MIAIMVIVFAVTVSVPVMPAAVQAALTNAALDPSLATVTIDGMDDGYGQQSTVAVAYPYEFVFLGPIMAFLGDGEGEAPGAITLTSQIVMRNE